MGLLDRLKAAFRNPTEDMIQSLRPLYRLERKASHLQCIAATAWPHWWEGRLEGRLLAFRSEGALAVYVGEVEEATHLYLGHVPPGKPAPAEGDPRRLRTPRGPHGMAVARAYRVYASGAASSELDVPAVQAGLLRLSRHVDEVSFYPKGLSIRIQARTATRQDVADDVKTALAIVGALEEREPPLIRAAEKGDRALVQSLLDQGDDPNARGLKAWTALMHAAANGHAAVVQALLDRGADVQAGAQGMTPLTLAAIAGKNEAFEKLAARTAEQSEGWGPALVAACRGGRGDLARLLLERGCHVNATHGGVTPLMAAAAAGQLPIVRMLLERGANPLMEDEQGSTAQALARAAGHDGVTRTLEEFIPRP